MCKGKHNTDHLFFLALSGPIFGSFSNTANMLSMEKLLKDMSLGAVSQLITTLISYLSYFIVLVYAAWLVLRGEFTAGSFFVAIGMIDQLSYPLISLAEIIRQLVAIRPACLKMEEFIAEGTSADSGKTLDAVRNGIHYQKVAFAYPGEKPILSDLSFEARKGGRYLIKGPSGCGKTTAVNLLLRYYDADEGSIEIVVSHQFREEKVQYFDSVLTMG